MEIDRVINDTVKNTVGYAEAENKESFIIGAQVAFKIAEDFYEKNIDRLNAELNQWKILSELVTKDISTVVDIFDKYRRHE